MMTPLAPTIADLYDEAYSSLYPDLYLHPWPDKHQMNLATIESLRATLTSSPSWLDLACGQAWHFSQLDGFRTKVGLDLSAAQLRRAQSANPDASFIRGDMTRTNVRPGTFDLVTNFWAGYSYLPDERAIHAFLDGSINAVAPGGSLYIEVLPPDSLPSFNASDFATQTGFRVASASAGFARWSYTDSGGLHRMLAIDVQPFHDALRSAFDTVQLQHDGAFLWHAVGINRLHDNQSSTRS